MNLNACLHLAWKEYRAMRAFWLSIVALVVFIEWLIFALYSSPTSVVLLYSFGLAAPAFFAIGATGAAFAMEQEEGTFDFLRASPITARQVLASKLGVASLATLAMFVVLWPLTLLFTYPKSPDALDGMLGLWLMAAVEAIAWGTLFSLLTARPLVAICLALAAASTVTHLLAWSVTTGRIYEFEFAPYLTAVPWRALVAVAVLAVDVYLGLRWLGAGTGGKIKLMIGRRKTAGLTQGAPAERTALKGPLMKPDRDTMRGHLLWQHWRQSAWLMALMAALHVALAVLVMYSGLAQSQQDVVLPLAVLAGLMGCCVFLPDQERRRFRFFVEHNVPPRYVWSSRQFPWIVTLFISTLVICLFWVPSASLASLWQLVKSATGPWGAYYGPAYGYFNDFVPFVDLPPMAFGLVCAAVSYCAGQWTSMFVRSGIMAGFFGLLLSAILCGWVGLMYAMQVSFLWSVTPIPLVLLWATWLRAPDWVRENTRWSARSRAAAVVLIPAIALIVAVPIYRVWQVALVGRPGFDPAEYLSQITPEGTATAALYRRADELYVGSGRGPTDTESKWLEENAKPLALVLEASRRPTCNFGDPRTFTERPRLRNEDWLISLILASGRQFEAEGKLDEALDRYFSALRVISHLPDSSLRPGVEPPDSAGQVFSKFSYWAAQKGQTAERIGIAIKRLQAIDASLLRLDDYLKKDYIVARRATFGDLGAWLALSGQAKEDGQIMQRMLWGKLMPWEKQRGLLVLNLLTATALDRLHEMRETLAGESGVVDFLEPGRSWSPIHDFAVKFNHLQRHDAQSRQKVEWLATTYTVWPGIGASGRFAAAELAEFEARRRAALLLLALEAHRLEHGGLPQSLSELVGPYFDALPLDPYSGHEFSYFPAGLPEPTTALEAAQLKDKNVMWRIWKRTSKVVPGKPCIWCTGQGLRVSAQYEGEPPERWWGPPEKSDRVVYYYTSRENADQWQPLLPYEAWSQGYWFPIPDKRQ
ncbi:MAG: ABC transporter permease [Planctomycetia bacterium]|nr:ABC transporter permease [Planctomycetia bacterium]